ncbi:MAG: ribose 5-phosphate isomerase B [Elusimicrobiota bacterium]
MKSLKIALGVDHAGFEMKDKLINFLKLEGHKIVDFGTDSQESCDYPDISSKVARAVASKKCDRGILMCGTGIGMSIAANKIKGARAAVVWSVDTAQLASQHNWANILCVGSRFHKLSVIKKMVKTWLSTPWEISGRHERRIGKIRKLESK